jgi:hypothetical protein
VAARRRGAHNAQSSSSDLERPAATPEHTRLRHPTRAPRGLGGAGHAPARARKRPRPKQGARRYILSSVAMPRHVVITTSSATLTSSWGGRPAWSCSSITVAASTIQLDTIHE